LYDTMSNKPPVLFRLHFTQPVYLLEWGPNINLRGAIGSGEEATRVKPPPDEDTVPSKKADYLLYAVVDFQACAFDPVRPSDPPVNLKVRTLFTGNFGIFLPFEFHASSQRAKRGMGHLTWGLT